jgi:hypothetical protein
MIIGALKLEIKAMAALPEYFKSEQFLKQIRRTDCWNMEEIPKTIRDGLFWAAQSALIGRDSAYVMNQYVIGLMDLGYSLDDDIPDTMDLSKIPKKHHQ